MYSYESMRDRYGSKVSQTVDSPIMVFDFFELSDVFLSVGIIMFFGVILYAWFSMLAALAISLVVVPIIKRRYPKGILLHCPYKNFGMSLPGIINPGTNKRFSN